MAVKTIQELIDMKAGFEEKKNKIYTVQTKIGDVKYKLASRTELVQIQEMDKAEIDPYLIFKFVVEPNLADKALQDAYKMTGIEPHQIVDKLFDMDDVGKLSLSIIGRSKKDIVKEIKN